MANTTSASPLRRSSRLNLGYPVRISGRLANNVPFAEETLIVTVSKYGAKLKTRIPLQVGTLLKLEPLRRRKSGVFKVVWVGREGTPRAGEVGIEHAGPVVDLLGISFPDQPVPQR
jgi:hypothetical protein